MSAAIPFCQPIDSPQVALRSAASAPAWLMKLSTPVIFSSVGSQAAPTFTPSSVAIGDRRALAHSAGKTWQPVSAPRFAFAATLAWLPAEKPALGTSPCRLASPATAMRSVVMAVTGFATMNGPLAAAPVERNTFTAQLGRTLLWLTTATAGGLSFSVGSVAGGLAGALAEGLAGALARGLAGALAEGLAGACAGSAAGSLVLGRLRGPARTRPPDRRRRADGSGGGVALGCSFGQGLSAFAMLVCRAPVTLAAIAAGAVPGLRYMPVGFGPPPQHGRSQAH